MLPSPASASVARRVKALHDHLVISLSILRTYWQAGRLSARIKRDVRIFKSSMAMNLENLRKGFEPLLRRIFHLYWRFARGMTLGVRAIVLNGGNRVFLVNHRHVAGWHLPGGGVEVGETFRDALRRELAEEAGIELAGEPALHGLFFNSHVSSRDHVALERSPRRLRRCLLSEAGPSFPEILAWRSGHRYFP